MNKNLRTNRGFTIVELLIVIVVIAILAAISIAVYNGISVKAKNASVASEVNAWTKAFRMYQAEHESWPSSMVPDKEYCLGTGFPVGTGGVPRCSDIRDASSPTVAASKPLMNQLSSVSKPGEYGKYPVNSSVGPYARLCNDWWRCKPGEVLITAIFQGGDGDCPKNMNQQWEAGGILWCDVALGA